MKKAVFLLILVVLVTSAIFAASPYYNLYKLHQAYSEQDVATIAASIDYAELQYNLSDELTTKLDKTLADNPIIAQLAGNNAAMLGKPFLKTAINGAITPENIENLVNSRDEISKETQQLAVAWAVATGKVDVKQLFTDVLTKQQSVEALIQQQLEQYHNNQQAQSQQKSADEKFVANYCGINCFSVAGDIKGYPLTVTLQRQGLVNWQIIDVDLP